MEKEKVESVDGKSPMTRMVGSSSFFNKKSFKIMEKKR